MRKRLGKDGAVIGPTRLGQVAWAWIGATAIVMCAMALCPWLKVLATSRQFHEGTVLFLVGLEYTCPAIAILSVAGSLAFGWLLLRARYRGAKWTSAACGLLVCMSSLLGLALAECVTAASLAWKDWRTARSIARIGLADEIQLPSVFPQRDHDNEVCLVVLGDSSAEGYPCHEWLSIGRLVAWQLECSIPSRHFRTEILAHAGDTLEAQHRKLADLGCRPDAIIIYCGHNEFAARYPIEREVGHYIATESPSSSWAIADRFVRHSSLGRWIQKLADAQSVGIAPHTHGARPLIDVPVYSQSESTERLADFHVRLDAIVTYCERIGALPILVIPPGNDADFEPNRSFLSRGTSLAEREAVRREFLKALREESLDPARSMERYRALLSRQPGFAEAHFRLARLLEQAGNWEEAYRQFVAARDWDGLPIRCPTSLQEAYRSVAGQHGGILVDGQKLFHEISQHGLLDDRLFLDAMHPTVRGHIALAQAILNALYARRSFGWPIDGAAPVIDPLACVSRFGIDPTVWRTLCERGALFYGGFGSSRYESSERLAKQHAFSEGAHRIAGGESPEAVGLLNIGLASERGETSHQMRASVQNRQSALAGSSHPPERSDQ